MAWTDEQTDTISTLTEVSSWATFVGTLFIIISYLIFKELQHFHLRLVFFLAIADFCTSITFLLNLHLNVSKNIFCEILAASLQFFELASALYAFSIAFVLNQVIRTDTAAHHIERSEKYFHVLCWSVATIATLGAGLQGLYLNTGLWCWISNDLYGVYRWIYFYGPLVVILCYVVTIYILVSRKIRFHMRFVMSSNSETTIQQTFRWYIIGWTICWVPAIIDRIQGIIQPNSPIYVLYAMHAFFAPLAGFCNSIALGFNDEIQAQYMGLLWKSGINTSTKIGSINNESARLLQEVMKEYEYSSSHDQDR